MKRKTPRQKFYEECVVRTIKRAASDSESPFYEIAKSFEFRDNITFPQIVMKANLKGTILPPKENFKRWGVGYLCQLVGFVEEENDLEFARKFFKFLKANKSLYKNPADKAKFGELLYGVYIDSILKDREFSCSLASFMIFVFRGEPWFEKFLTLCMTFVSLDTEATDEYYKIRQGKTPTESIGKIINGHAGNN